MRRANTSPTRSAPPSQGQAALVHAATTGSQGLQAAAVEALESGDATGSDAPRASESKLRKAAASAREELADFFSDWFGALRLHHKEEEELQAVRPRPREAEQAAVLGKATQPPKSEVRRAKFQVVKDPRTGRKSIREPKVSSTKVADYRNYAERELKGTGWGGPPIKRPKRKDNRDLTPAQQMQLDMEGQTVPEEDQEGLADMIQGQVHEEDTEFFVMQSFPVFTLIQSVVIFLGYVVLSTTSGIGLAGLETFFPGQTDLALTNVVMKTGEAACQDFRWQLWRAITYQYSHSSFSHMLGNVLLLVLCGINLEGFHGSLRLMWMFEIGVLGGAGAVCVFDSHTRVVGMSGGAYALLGMQLGDVLLNWERKSAPYRLAFIFLLVLVEVMLYLFNPQDEISYSAHMGGGLAGLLLVIVFGRNLTIKTYDLEVQVMRIAKVLLFGLAAFCLCWTLVNWPPMSLLDQVPWCWAREVSNETLFGDGEFHCVRCDGPACIARWSPPLQNESYLVNPKSCSSWAASER